MRSKSRSLSQTPEPMTLRQYCAKKGIIDCVELVLEFFESDLAPRPPMVNVQKRRSGDADQ
jgi:hypothetical protein